MAVNFDKTKLARLLELLNDKNGWPEFSVLWDELVKSAGDKLSASIKLHEICESSQGK